MSLISSLMWRRRAGIYLLLTAVSFGPVLLRALPPRLPSPSVRLNRGYEAPPSKWKVAPPSESVPQSTAVEASAQSRFAVRTLRASDETIPDSPLVLSPGPQRGPPLAHVV